MTTESLYGNIWYVRVDPTAPSSLTYQDLRSVQEIWKGGLVMVINRKAFLVRMVLALLAFGLLANIGVLASNWAAGSVLLTATGAPAGANYAWTAANALSGAAWVVGLAFCPVSAPIAIGVGLFMIA